MSKLEFSAEIIWQDNINSNFKYANEFYIFIPFTPQSIISLVQQFLENNRDIICITIIIIVNYA